MKGMSSRVHTQRALRLGVWGAGVPLLLAWLAPLLVARAALWLSLCSLATLLVAGAVWRLAYHIATPLNTAANLVTALRKGDYSLRGRIGLEGDDADLLLGEINGLATQLRSGRVGEAEASELLEKVMSEIDTAVLAFDGAQQLVLENPAAALLLGQAPGSLTGQTAQALGLDCSFSESSVQRLMGDLPGALGPFELRVQPFRYRGRPHTLVVMTSVGRLLREEERRAHRQIISVLSHEINNSLAPIKSLAGRLQSLTAQLQQPAPAAAADSNQGALDDIQTGLTVIARRSGHLAQVMSDYARLARSPEPRRAPIGVRVWIERHAQLWPGVVVSEASPAELSLTGDEALLDQVLLNLIKNALEASVSLASPTGPSALPVTISWHSRGRWLAIVVSDRGCGLPDDIDPFLPFVTTKPEGSGIGLSLCREVAEAHGGRLELVNRSDGPGCLARLTLPLEG